MAELESKKSLQTLSEAEVREIKDFGDYAASTMQRLNSESRASKEKVGIICIWYISSHEIIFSFL